MRPPPVSQPHRKIVVITTLPKLREEFENFEPSERKKIIFLSNSYPKSTLIIESLRKNLFISIKRKDDTYWQIKIKRRF